MTTTADRARSTERARLERTPNKLDIEPATGVTDFDNGTRALFQGRIVWVLRVIGQMTPVMVHGHMMIDETPADKRVIWWATPRFTTTQPVKVGQLSPVIEMDEESEHDPN